MTQHVHRHLSAYIDGEAPHPERIAAHLAQCEACARHHKELLQLSQRMRALPFPEVRPEFTTRVMAHVRETESAPRHALRPFHSVAIAGVSIIVVLVSVWAFQSDTHGKFDANVKRSEGDSWVTADSTTGSSEYLGDSWANEDTTILEDWPEDIVEPLHDVWDTPLVEAWGPPEDLDGLLLRLDEDEQKDFRALLWLYAQESDVI